VNLSTSSFSSYFKSFLTAFFVAVAIVVLINVIVDPYDKFGWIEIEGFNAMKYSGDSRVAKSIAVSRGKYDALLFGSSRSEIGLSPFHPGWRGMRTYNLSLPATNMYETFQVFNYAIDQHKPKLVLLSLDFLMFTERRKTNRDFELSRFNRAGSLLAPVREAVGVFALKESVETVRKNRKRAPKTYNSGFRNGEIVFSAAVKQIGHRQLFRNSLLHNFLLNSQTYRGYRYSADRISMLGKLLKACLENGIGVIIVIPPVHALQLETIHSLGLWHTFEQWKRDMLDLVVKLHAESAIPIYDFTSWQGINAEDVPNPGNRKNEMQWFWESSHFKKELGDLVLDRVFGLTGKDQKIPEGFGVRLTTANIDSHLAALRNGRNAYIGKHQDEIKDLKRLFKLAGL